MPASARSVNAWLLVGEDDPPDTTYFSPNSAYGLNGLDIDWEPPLSDETTIRRLRAT